MRRNRPAALMAFVVAGSLACSEIAPTGVDESVLPEQPVTVEVRIPWDEFGSDLAVFGGFGSTDDLGVGVVGHTYGDSPESLEAHTLVRLADVPTSASVRDTTGTQRPDSVLQVLRGRIIAVVDSIGTVADGPVSLQVGMFHQPWDAPTATWEMAVDSTGEQTAWEEAGAGPVSNVLTTTWDPQAGDSAVFELDSAQVAAWSDTAADNQGLRLTALTEGVRLEVTTVLMQVDTKPSLNPDTTVVLVANRQQMTFVYTPSVPVPSDEVRVGGTPSWRSVLDIRMPQTLDGPAELCARVTCPVELTAGRLNYAAIVFRSRPTQAAFAPSDTVNLDARPVFDRSTLPKSPLGNSLFTSTVGRRLGPELFTNETETEVEIPITSFARTLLQPDSTSPIPPPHTLAFMSTFEPVSIAFASFYGPASLQAPVLKLVITAGRSVELP